MDGRRDAVVTSLKEPFTAMDERRLKATITDHLREGRVIHVIDLSELETISTRSLHTLLSLFYAAQRKNGVLALVITRPLVLKLLEMTGLDGIFPVFSDVQQAVRTIFATTEVVSC